MNVNPKDEPKKDENWKEPKRPLNSTITDMDDVTPSTVGSVIEDFEKRIADLEVKVSTIETTGDVKPAEVTP